MEITRKVKNNPKRFLGHPMRTHPKRTQGECLQFFVLSPHEAEVFLSRERKFSPNFFFGNPLGWGKSAPKWATDVRAEMLVFFPGF